MNIGKNAIVAIILLTSGLAHAQWSANLGWQSDYYFRGILQKSSSAQGGVDYEHDSGFYAGVWGADVGGGVTGDGLEVDGYFGYNGAIGEFTYGAGFTGYYYTGDFDDTYQEINLSGGYEFLTFAMSLGEYDNSGGPTLDYQFYSLTAEYEGFWAQYGTFEDDFDGDYFQVGYNTEIAEFDVGISLLYSDETLVGESEEALIFSLGKSFDLQ